MTPEVKQRIEQIRQGIVPEGYVKDKDGIYPRDWASKKIGQWLKLAERPIVLQDEEEYQLVTVRRGFGGVDSRGSFLGKNVLVKNYFIVKTGDFIISKRQIAHGACGIVPPELYGAVVSNEYNVFLPQDGTNIQMFNLMMQLPHYKRLFYLMSDGVHIEKLLFKTQDWMKRTLAMPLLKEQKKIAEILATQDKAIELQGRKIEELKRFKKGCLEKMFPRKGQKVPEKRFPGFTDDWEQRKAIDIADYSKGNGYSKGDLTDAGTPIILYGRLYTKYQFAISEVDTFAVPRNGAVYSQGNEVIVPASGETAEDIARASAVEKSGVLLGGDLNILRPFDFITPLFLALAISNGEPQKELAKKAQGKSVVHIHNTDIQEVTIAYPSRTEQDRIVSVFRQLDNLITLHQRKLEEMKKQKKALMQLLLTGIVKTKGEVR